MVKVMGVQKARKRIGRFTLSRGAQELIGIPRPLQRMPKKKVLRASEFEVVVRRKRKKKKRFDEGIYNPLG